MNLVNCKQCDSSQDERFCYCLRCGAKMPQTKTIIFKLKDNNIPKWEETAEYTREQYSSTDPSEIRAFANRMAMNISYSHHCKVRWNIEGSPQGNYINAWD